MGEVNAGNGSRASLGMYIARSARYWPDRPAVIFRDRSLSFRELEARSNRLAHALQALGIQRGDRVAEAAAHGAHAFVEGRRDGGERHAARRPLEQRESNLPFEPLHTLDDRRLRDANRCSGTARLPVLGDGEEVVDVFKANGHGFIPKR